jgi:1-acyl-sn-glycerol-3-phosphate acyltransferase
MLFFLFFGKIKAGNLVYKACTLWGRTWYFFIGIRHKEIYEVPHNKNKQYIFVANHSSYMDIPSIVMCIHQPVRALGKYEMVRYPIFGLIYRAAAILVDRSDAAHRAKSVRALKAAIEKGISIFIFPEGTFNESNKPLKEFYNGAFRTAIETQTPIKPILFVDNEDRLNRRSIFSLTPGISRCVFLDEIKVDGYTTKHDVELLKAIVYSRMEEGLYRYKMLLYDQQFYELEKHNNHVLREHKLVDKNANDYPANLLIAREKLMQGNNVDIMPVLNQKSSLRKIIFPDAKGNTNADLRINSMLVEIEEPKSALNFNTLKHSIDAGSHQANYVIVKLNNHIHQATLRRLAKGRFIDHKDLHTIEFRDLNGNYISYARSLLKK